MIVAPEAAREYEPKDSLWVSDVHASWPKARTIPTYLLQHQPCWGRLSQSGTLLGGRLRQRRSFWSCSHSSTITTITAGIAREVCEVCSHVSVSYVEPAVRLHPDIETRVADPGLETNDEPIRADLDDAKVFEAMVSFEQSSRFLRCALCTQQAAFIVPDGLRCDEHAWQAAALIDWEAADPWVPIRIDRSNA